MVISGSGGKGFVNEMAFDWAWESRQSGNLGTSGKKLGKGGSLRNIC